MKTNDNNAVPIFFAERAREIAEFCLRRAPQIFGKWPVPTLFAYVFFCTVDRTVFVVRDHGAIAAVLFAWGQNEKEIRRRAAAGEDHFGWTRADNKADALFLAEVIGRRRWLTPLAKQVSARFPGWEKKKVFTFRGRDLVQLEGAVIRKMLYGQT